MVVTFDTTHFERSLLNTPAYWNAVQSFNKKEYKRKVQEKNINNYIVYNKWKKRSRQKTKILKLIVYVLPIIERTFETVHFEISLLNTDASRNAVQPFKQQWCKWKEEYYKDKEKMIKKKLKNVGDI